MKNKLRDFIVKKTEPVKFINYYLTDYRFKGHIKLYQGATVDFFYMLFKLITGIVYSSVWSVTLAAYHFFLGFSRVYLIICRHSKKRKKENLLYEYKCYKKTAWFLFLLNVPMSVMIFLMVWKNSGFTYPGYVIYLSAFCTFYTAVMSVVNIIKFKKVGSPILSAAKAVNLVAAMMSLLGLQTALIAAFPDNHEAFRQQLNAVAGAIITIAVIAIAIYMIINATKKINEFGNQPAMTYEHDVKTEDDADDCEAEEAIA